VQPQLEPVRDYLSTRNLAVTYQTNTIGYYIAHYYDQAIAHAAQLNAQS
jgi:hypothetical protein